MTPALRNNRLPPHRLALSHGRHMYWTPAQMIAHHTVGGCNLQPGDLLGSGTISAPDLEGCGSILELTLGGKNPVRLASGEERRFLEDGDEVILRGRATLCGVCTDWLRRMPSNSLACEMRSAITPAAAAALVGDGTSVMIGGFYGGWIAASHHRGIGRSPSSGFR